MTVTVDNLLKEHLATSSHVFWAGAQPPLACMNASTRIFDPDFDYRMPADFHQKFNLVFLVERDLGSVKAWPLVVDEALRLLAPGGLLAIRMNNSALLTIFELKNFIASWGQMSPYFEHTHDDGVIQFAVKNTRCERRQAELAGFSFGVITDGKRPDQIKCFIDSVQRLERPNSEEVEILVCGPHSLEKQPDLGRDGVVFVPEPEDFKTQGWITRKKNLIVHAARHENLVIVHDRYTLPSDFIKRLRRFGGDYSVLVCRQLRPDGRRIPDWITLGGEWSWTAPATLEYGDWTRYVYVNGGIMIAKAEVLRKVGWNELLFWKQAEDVELTRRLRSYGYVPRLARDVIVFTLPIRKGFVEIFEAVPLFSDRHMLPGPPNSNAEFVIPSLRYGQPVNFGAESDHAAELGVYCDVAWHVEPHAISLAAKSWGEVTFRLAHIAGGSPNILMKVKETGNDFQILVNDVVARVDQTADDLLSIVAPEEAFLCSSIVRLHLRAENSKIELHNLMVTAPTYNSRGWDGSKQSFCEGSTATCALGKGWSQPEHWGCWTDGDWAELTVKTKQSHSDLLIQGTAQGFVRAGARRQIIGLMANGIAVGHFALNADLGPQKFGVVIANEFLRGDDVLTLAFTPLAPCSPLEIGLSQDRRRLGMGLINLAVSPVPVSYIRREVAIRAGPVRHAVAILLKVLQRLARAFKNRL